MKEKHHTHPPPKKVLVKNSWKQLPKFSKYALHVFLLRQIAGPPGCGKTQFCIMLSVLATLPVTMGGLDGGVAYIDTESAFSAERSESIHRNNVGLSGLGAQHQQNKNYT